MIILPSHSGAGNGDVSVVIVDPQGKKDTVELLLENKGDSVFRCTYRPMLEGPHTIHVLFGGQEIPRSPFTVNITEGEPSVAVVNYCQTNQISFHAFSVEGIYPSQVIVLPGNIPLSTDHNPSYLSFLALPIAPPTGAPLQIVPQSVRTLPGAKGGKGVPPQKPGRPS